jgi:hypothetical protein
MSKMSVRYLAIVMIGVPSYVISAGTSSGILGNSSELESFQLLQLKAVTSMDEAVIIKDNLK